MAYSVAYSTTPTTATSTTEKSILALPAVQYAPTGNYQGVLVGGMLNFTVGGTGATMVVTIRNGSGTSGTAIGQPMTVNTTAAQTFTVPISVVDTTNPPASQYNITLTGGASANGSHVANQAFIWVDPVVL